MVDVVLTEGWSGFDQAPGALLLADDDMLVVRVNDAFCAAVGHARDEILGRDANEYISDDAPEAARTRPEALPADDRPYSFARHFEHADGSHVRLRVHVGAVEGPSGRRYLMGRVEDAGDARRIAGRPQHPPARDQPVEPGKLPALHDTESGSGKTLGLLGRLQTVADAPTVEHTLQAVRDLLGMDVSYVTQHTDTEQVLLATEGDAASFGVRPGTRIPLDATYCQLILRGELPAAMPDVLAIPAAAALPVTAAAGVGAYASVPIRLSDGTLYGTLCAANHHVVAQLGERDVQFLAVLARLLAGELERDAALRAQLALRVQAAGAEALLSAIEARDCYTGAHSREVVELATAVAAELALPERVQREVAQIALLHDIGKLALPDSILSKPGPLTHEEIVLMRRHPEDGERIVAAIPELAYIAEAIRAEHERWDGAGYPDGLAGEAIPIASRIVFVCDAWDAMTSDRPYRPRMARDKAIAEIAGGAGSQFCDVCVQALFAVLARS